MTLAEIEELRATITLRGDPSTLERVWEALLPEAETPPRYRAKVKLMRSSPRSFSIALTSPDLSSLRASLNSFMRILIPLLAVSREGT